MLVYVKLKVEGCRPAFLDLPSRCQEPKLDTGHQGETARLATSRYTVELELLLISSYQEKVIYKPNTEDCIEKISWDFTCVSRIKSCPL